MNDDHGARKRGGLPVKLFPQCESCAQGRESLLKVVIMDGREKRVTKFTSRLSCLSRLWPNLMKEGLPGRFLKCWAQCAMRSSVEDGTSGGGRRYVASAMSKEKQPPHHGPLKNGE